MGGFSGVLVEKTAKSDLQHGSCCSGKGKTCIYET